MISFLQNISSTDLYLPGQIRRRYPRVNVELCCTWPKSHFQAKERIEKLIRQIKKTRLSKKNFKRVIKQLDLLLDSFRNVRS